MNVYLLLYPQNGGLHCSLAVQVANEALKDILDPSVRIYCRALNLLDIDASEEVHVYVHTYMCEVIMSILILYTVCYVYIYFYMLFTCIGDSCAPGGAC